MQLWNDYEGKTIADTYALGPLLRPEGRSALFALPQGAEAPAVIRLTESLNDEGQILSSWKRVSEVHQENLVALKRFGETTFEGTPLTYAVMEQPDANLADLLKERPLTHAEAKQVATSLVAAVGALHSRNLIHEHIDASHVVAVGETVKLRTDCVRECVIHPDDATPDGCQRLMRRDVHDLATLLLTALTLETQLKPGITLPSPFNQIIPNALSGAWGIAEVSAALNPRPAGGPAVPLAGAPAGAASEPDMRTPTTAAAPTKVVKEPERVTGAVPVSDPLHFQRRIHTSTIPVHPHAKLWAMLGAVAVIILAVLVHGISSGPRAATTPAPVNTPAVGTPAATPAVSARGAQPGAEPHAAAKAPVVMAPPVGAPAPTAMAGSPAAHLQPGWYVVAYTFNRQADADKRAAAIARRNPGLRPEVITPSGRSPYLVALGGSMTRPAAESVQRRARQSGLPRDTFVRNYRGR